MLFLLLKGIALLKTWLHSLTTGEKALWAVSSAAIILSYAFFGGQGWLTLAASLIGVTSLLLAAKGHYMGQALMIVFSLLYGVISYGFSYYGEMLTYLCMTMPMAALSLWSWLRHPYHGQQAQVQVGHLLPWEKVLLPFATAAVTAPFYFLLAHFHTANLLPSTISVATSFLAVYLTFRRSPWYAAGYAANDVVLVILWLLASREDHRYLSMVVCFLAFLMGDLYGFVSWRRMARHQAASQ